ncbi:MAG: hypothetical protein IJX98_05840 [Clostridia bacterium]|nr:hypothetical protein [Clostridia bacterium]
MKRGGTAAFAITAIVFMLAGITLAVFCGWSAGMDEGIDALVGVIVSFVVAPVLHEVGHVGAAACGKMECVQVKCFCFRYIRENNKGRITLVSPFADDQTQVIPKTGGNMLARAKAYTLGGLLLEGAFTVIVAGAAITLACLHINSFTLWGLLPYLAYLFLINAMPLEYPSGKTDMLAYIGLKKGYPTEKNMLAAMEIQGELYEGKSFSEIDERLYFNAPQLCEDEPLYAVMLDLKYRYFLEKGDMEKSADCLNRLARNQEYLSDREVEKVAAELTYMHSLNGDHERAKDCSKLCEDYLKTDAATAKRALAAYCKAFGKEEAVELLIEQAEVLLQKERVKGLVKAERILLSRLA